MYSDNTIIVVKAQTIWDSQEQVFKRGEKNFFFHNFFYNSVNVGLGTSKEKEKEREREGEKEGERGGKEEGAGRGGEEERGQ